MQRKISVFCPHIPESVIDVAVQTLKAKWINVGEETSLFEQAFAEKFKLKFAVALNSCTSALRLSYAIAGVGPGDEVVTPAFTMVATNTAVLEQFGKPVFADVAYETANIDPAEVEKKITKKTKAIACVHNLGYACDLTELRAVAAEHNLPLIEDCAHAIGATYKDKFIGEGSDFACYSFAPVKHITTGDGGLLATQNHKIFQEADVRSWFGMRREKRDKLTGRYNFDITQVGFKMRLNSFLSSIGREQLRYIDEILKKRREKAIIYDDELEGVRGINLMEYESNRQSSFHLYPVHVEHRQRFAEMMNSKGIELYAQNFRNDQFSVFGGIRKDLPNTDRIDQDFICLPIHENLTQDDLDYIIATVKAGW